MRSESKAPKDSRSRIVGFLSIFLGLAQGLAIFQVLFEAQPSPNRFAGAWDRAFLATFAALPVLNLAAGGFAWFSTRWFALRPSLAAGSLTLAASFLFNILPDLGFLSQKLETGGAVSGEVMALFGYTLPLLLWLAWARMPFGGPRRWLALDAPAGFPRPLVPSPSVDSRFRMEALAEFMAEASRNPAAAPDVHAPSGHSFVEDARIREVLRDVRAKIGEEPVEHAFWVLFPPDPTAAPFWIGAIRPPDDALTGIHFPHVAPFCLSPKEEAAFLAAAEEAQGLFHVHNHPRPAGDERPLGESDGDRGFSAGCKSEWKSLKGKMRFFVVDSTGVLEYARPDGEPVLWEA